MQSPWLRRSLLALLGVVGWSLPADARSSVQAGSTLTSTNAVTRHTSGNARSSCVAVTVLITTDTKPTEISWLIYDPLGNILEGSPPYSAASTTTSHTFCLPPGGRYRFSLNDAGMDGINSGSAGGWELRDATNRTALKDDGFFLSISPNNPPLAAGYDAHELHLPLGPTNIWTASPYAVCGNFNMGILNKVRCTTVAGASQYQFEFIDPNTGYRRRVSSGVNFVLWTSMGGNAPRLGVRYFVRSRVDQGTAGFADDNWGSGCDMAWTSSSPTWCTGLVSTPGNTFSCGASLPWGGTSKLWAQPVPGAVPYDANADGDLLDANDQPFAYHFRITGANSTYLKDAYTSSYTLPLTWTVNPMAPGVYNVQVRVQLGGVWQPFCGPGCQVTIVPSGPMQAGTVRNLVNPATAPRNTLALWPNPNRGDELYLTLDQLDAELTTATMDLYDLFGKRVATFTLPVRDGLLNTALNLNDDLASGMYLVTVIAGEQQFTQRLVIE